MSWADVATRVYELLGHDASEVTRVSTEQYYADRGGAPRPLSSVLDLTKIEGTGFTPGDSSARIDAYVASLA